MTGNDLYTSNLICEDCILPIIDWLSRKEVAAKSQMVFNFIMQQVCSYSLFV